MSNYTIVMKFSKVKSEVSRLDYFLFRTFCELFCIIDYFPFVRSSNSFSRKKHWFLEFSKNLESSWEESDEEGN